MLGISSSITKSDRRKWCLARINLLRTASRICGKTTLFTLGAVHLKNWCDTNMFTSHWLLTFWCCLALRARCGSRWSRVSISSPSFSLLSYSWKHFQPKEKKKDIHHTSQFCLIQDILGCNKYLEDWPGTPYQWPPSPEREHTCNSETRPLPGSWAWAGGIFWTSPALHRSQSWTPPAAALDGSTREPLPLRYWPAEEPQVQRQTPCFHSQIADIACSCTVPYSDTHFQQLHDGAIFGVVGVQPRLCCPLSNFFHVIESRCPDICDGIKTVQATKNTKTVSRTLNYKHIQFTFATHKIK